MSAVAANPDVRAVMVRRQREWAAERGGGVIEGRDIGSVVFPAADLKIYLTASAEERARRRPEEGADAVARRDRIDSTRDGLAARCGRGGPGHRHHRPPGGGDRGGGRHVAVTGDGDGDGDGGGPSTGRTGVRPGRPRGPDRHQLHPDLPVPAPAGARAQPPPVPHHGGWGRPGARHRAGDHRPGAPVVHRLLRGLRGHQAQAPLHGQGQPVEAPAAGPHPSRRGRLPRPPRVGRPRGTTPGPAGARRRRGADPVPRGRASYRSGGRGSPRGRGLPRRPHRRHRGAGGHRGFGLGHAQGQAPPSAPAHPSHRGPSPSPRRPAPARAGCRGAPSTC